jgi:hypothetical protein
MKRKNQIILFAITVIAGFFLWKFWLSEAGMQTNFKFSEDLGKPQVYKTEENNFAFVYPEKLKITESAIEGVDGGKRILAESGEVKKGFEVVILPFDENNPITKERILQDVPDMVINNEKEITVGNGIYALSFDGTDENIGNTSEIWFTHNGFLYEAQTYPEFGPQMAEILKTWQFK